MISEGMVGLGFGKREIMTLERKKNNKEMGLVSPFKCKICQPQGSKNVAFGPGLHWSMTL